MTVDPSGPAIDLHVPVHVIIGTTPLRSVVQQYQTQFGMSTPETPALPSLGPNLNPSVAPTDMLNLRECIYISHQYATILSYILYIFFNMADPLTLSEHDVLCFIKHAKLACFKIFDVCYLLILFAYSFFFIMYN